MSRAGAASAAAPHSGELFVWVTMPKPLPLRPRTPSSRCARSLVPVSAETANGLRLYDILECSLSFASCCQEISDSLRRSGAGRTNATITPACSASPSRGTLY